MAVSFCVSVTVCPLLIVTKALLGGLQLQSQVELLFQFPEDIEFIDLGFSVGLKLGYPVTFSCINLTLPLSLQ